MPEPRERVTVAAMQGPLRADAIPAPLRPLLACGRCRRSDLREDADGALRCAGCAAIMTLRKGVLSCGGAIAGAGGWDHDGLLYDRAMRYAVPKSLCEAVDPLVLPALRGAVLEIGCGSGRFLIEAAGRAWPLVGVDANFAMIERAAERGLPHLVHAPAERLPFRDRSFDTVVSVLAWHLVPEEAYAEVGRVLRPGGRFVYHLHGGGTSVAHVVWHRARRALKRRLGTLSPEDGHELHAYYGDLVERRRLSNAGLALESAAVARPAATALAALAARASIAFADDVVVVAAKVL